jgi:hypothetical protein
VFLGFLKVMQWFQQQIREFFAEAIHLLLCQCVACLSTYGTVFNGFHSCVQNNPQMGFISTNIINKISQEEK